MRAPLIVGCLEGRRENGPATRAHSTRSAACKDSRSMQLLRRTCEEGRQAPPKMRFLVVVVERNRIVSCAPARRCSESSPQTRIDRLLLSKRLACGCKGIGRGVEAHACQGTDAMAKDDQRAHYCTRKATCSWRPTAESLGCRQTPRRRDGLKSARPTEASAPIPSWTSRQRPRTLGYAPHR